MSTSSPSSWNLPTPAELARQYLHWLRMRNCSPITLASWEFRLRRFNQWCDARGVTSVQDVTPEVLAAYHMEPFSTADCRTHERSEI